MGKLRGLVQCRIAGAGLEICCLELQGHGQSGEPVLLGAPRNPFGQLPENALKRVVSADIVVECCFRADALGFIFDGNAARVLASCEMKQSRSHHAIAAQEFGPEYGYYSAAATHAFGATRHMHLYGTKKDHFGAIAVAFREHALRNPQAMMKKPLTMADYHNQRSIVWPFGLLDCSLRSDAAGAMIVTSRERAKDLKQPPVVIKGFGTHNNLRGWFMDDNMVVTAAKKSGETAYKMAGMGPRDMEMAMIYDSFTITVLATLENLGFCKPGEGGAFVSGGRIGLGGELPLNPDGGGLSSNHPGMRGIFLVIEAVKQLRGECGERQVANAGIALAHGTGGTLGVAHSGATLILGPVMVSLSDDLAAFLHRTFVGGDRVALVLGDLVDHADVGMAERGGHPRLAKEAVARLFVGRVGGKHLEGHRAMKPQIFGQEHFALF